MYYTTKEGETKTVSPETERLIHAPSILDILEEELRIRGFSGPADVPKLVFLSLYTRYFEKPVSLVIKGPSGSGKSYALEAGLQFIPEAAFEQFSGRVFAPRGRSVVGRCLIV